jgi:hypothetical protein
MKKIRVIFFVFLSIIILSCEKKDNKKTMSDINEAPYNISDIGDGKKFNYDTLSVEYIKKVETSLINNKFKFPDEKIFRDKVLEVFKIDLYDYKNKIIVLRPAMFTEIAIKESKFILVEDEETDGSEDVINDNLELYYNSYVFNGDKIAFNWLKSRNKQRLIDLVVQYGYDSDKELVTFVLKNFDFDDNVSFHDLIFTYDVKSKKYILRENILNDIENIIYKGTVEGYTEAKEGNGYNSFSDIIEKIRSNLNNYLDAEKYIAFLYEKDLRVGIVGHVESNLSDNPNYKSFLKQNNYFNLKRLKDYVENVYGGDSNSDEVSRVFKISDPDGFTNLRKEKNTSSEILQKINNSSEVEVLDNSEDWWLVQTKEGRKGYVYKTKIKSE